MLPQQLLLFVFSPLVESESGVYLMLNHINVIENCNCFGPDFVGFIEQLLFGENTLIVYPNQKTLLSCPSMGSLLLSAMINEDQQLMIK